MTHIEQLHLDAIYGSILAGPKALEAAEAAAEITENIACEFADWLVDIKSSIAYNDETCLRLYKKSTKELFQEYLKTKENDTPDN